MKINNPFSNNYSDTELPDSAVILRMDQPKLVSDVGASVKEALLHPIESNSLSSIALEKKKQKSNSHAIIVVSDNTRPVPYKGPDGILMPIIQTLLDCNYKSEEITIMVATGTHRAMTDQELRNMLDEKVFELGLKVINHNCRDKESLVFLGNTKRGTEVWMNKLYMSSELKIATGLIESHFMAGASGGRKAICPGLIGEKTTYVFHGPELMADSRSCDLNINGNPVHEESLEVAKMAGVDFLVNVTLDHEFRITGLFCGDLQKAHLAGVEKIRSCVQINTKPADIVITHGGFVGINHYQVAKCAVASLGILKEGGYLIILANTTDAKNKIGSLKYKISLALLKETGADAFLRTISSKDWTFLPDQWQVQQWAKVFKRIPMDHLYLFSPKLEKSMWETIPGNNGELLPSVDASDASCFNVFVKEALEAICQKEQKSLEQMSVAYIADGPYSVPRTEGKNA